MRDPCSTFEVTIRTVQSRFLLRPSKQLNDVILGILGRALELYPVLLHVVVVASNHIHLIITAPDMKRLSDFMRYLNSNIAREVGRLHGWREKFWGRRYTDEVILTDEDLIKRVRYLLSHGCKEGLVLRPGDWPGIHCVDALLRGKKLVGTWYDRSKEYEARRSGQRGEAAVHASRYEVPLSPLPFRTDRSPEERRALMRSLVADIELETKARYQRRGLRVLGARRVRAQDPHGRPRETKRSPRPPCHCSDPELRRKYRDDYRWFVSLHRQASQRLRAGEYSVAFPPNCFPPPLAFRRLGPEPAG